MSKGKGFLGKIGSVFLEEVDDTDSQCYDENVRTEYDVEEPSTAVDVNTELSEDVTEETLIDDIYINNDMTDTSRSIFKVEEIRATLPNELPTDAKRITVSSLLKTFNLTLTEVTEDGEKRLEILNGVNEHNKQVALEETNSCNNKIESLKKEISELEKRKIEITHNTSMNSHIIDEEVSRISELVKFISGGENK